MGTNGKVKAITIGPRDHGRRMSLREFEFAEGKEVYRYELSRGVITVMNIPRFRHLLQLTAVRNQLVLHEIQNPGEIYIIAGGMDSKVLAWDWESERHPDICVYLSAPPKEDASFWTKWVPEII